MRQKIDHILRGLSTEGLPAVEIRARAISAAIEHGLNWEQTVLLIDELERLTGLQLHHSPLTGNY